MMNLEMKKVHHVRLNSRREKRKWSKTSM